MFTSIKLVIAPINILLYTPPSPNFKYYTLSEINTHWQYYDYTYSQLSRVVWGILFNL